MKKILLILCLLPTFALAKEQWLEMRNNAGGKILLLLQKCDDDQGRMAIATTSEGISFNGCWYYFSEMIHIVWKHGKTSSFEPKEFTVRESK